MKNYILIGLAAIGMLASSSLFVIDESQRGIVVQFGKVIREGSSDIPKVYEPGLHWKWPFIDDVRKLDARIQTLDGQADRFVTSEKKDLIIDSYVKWRIEDFSKYIWQPVVAVIFRLNHYSNVKLTTVCVLKSVPVLSRTLFLVSELK